MRPVRVAVAGSVDDGKSTLLGRLLFDAERVFGDEVKAVQQASGDDLNLAFFTDGLMLERREGITLDVAWRHLVLGKRRLLLADVPGHAELVRNMASGASTADAALLLVDAERGIQAQTRRHLAMLGGLGVRQVVVCINKMDAVGFDEAVVARLSRELHRDSPARRTTPGLSEPVEDGPTEESKARPPTLEVIPISALAGDNLVQRSKRMPWYRGPTVAERLQTLEPAPTPAFTRAVVQLDSDGDGWTALQVLSGVVRPGEVLITWPERGEVRVLETTPFSARLARPLRRGTLLTSPDAPAQVSSRVTLIATWLGPAPREETLLLLQHGRKTNARVPGLSEPVEDGPTVTLELDLERPTWFDRWDDSPLTASCLLLDARGRTVGGGRFT